MRFTLLSLFIGCIFFQTFSQNEEPNIFLDRDFWKSKPTVALIQEKIAEGHDPTESAESGFDGVAYGIIDEAPVEGIKYLLTLKGNPVSKLTHGGLTYLAWSSYKGNFQLVEHLLELEADVHASNAGGTNCLLMAAIGGVENKDLYELFFSNGIDVNYTNDNGSNVLLTLAGSDAEDPELFQYFADKGLSWESTDDDGNGLFSYAARAGNMKILRMLLDKDIDYSMMNQKGENTLFFATYGRRRREVSIETFLFLDSLGLDVDVVNWDGKTPLHNIAMKGNPELIDFFIDRGVNVNQIDEDGNTAFINSVAGKIENVKKLRPLIKDINQVNKEGYSALSKALIRGNKEAFSYLLEEGADISILDNEGNDLMCLAFQNYSSRREDEIKEMIDLMIAKGLQLKDSYAEGNTLAHHAVKKQNKYLLNKAIELGADLNLKNELGINALHFAAMKATDTEMIEIMLASGANKNILTEFEESTYDLASENELLIENEIDISMLKVEK